MIKKRVSFDFSEEAFRKLGELVRRSDSKSKADVVRKALKLYDLWLIKTKEECFTPVFKKGRKRLGVEGPL